MYSRAGIPAAWTNRARDLSNAPANELTPERLAEIAQEIATEVGSLNVETFGLDRVEWIPLAPWVKRAYEIFTRMPPALMASAAFVSELMGLTVYLQLDKMLDDIVGDEPDVRDRIRELLRAIMTDELSHVGERRNFMGPIGLGAARLMVRPMFRAFFGGIPEAPLLFDTRQMRRDAEAFDYSTIGPDVLEVSWVPSYCIRHP